MRVSGSWTWKSSGTHLVLTAWLAALSSLSLAQNYASYSACKSDYDQVDARAKELGGQWDACIVRGIGGYTCPCGDHVTSQNIRQRTACTNQLAQIRNQARQQADDIMRTCSQLQQQERMQEAAARKERQQADQRARESLAASQRQWEESNARRSVVQPQAGNAAAQGKGRQSGDTSTVNPFAGLLPGQRSDSRDGQSTPSGSSAPTSVIGVVIHDSKRLFEGVKAAKDVLSSVYDAIKMSRLDDQYGQRLSRRADRMADKAEMYGELMTPKRNDYEDKNFREFFSDAKKETVERLRKPEFGGSRVIGVFQDMAAGSVRSQLQQGLGDLDQFQREFLAFRGGDTAGPATISSFNPAGGSQGATGSAQSYSPEVSASPGDEFEMIFVGSCRAALDARQRSSDVTVPAYCPQAGATSGTQ